MAAVFASGLLPATAYSAGRSSTSSDAMVTSVSCAPAGSCAAGGQVFNTAFHGQAFVLTGKNGKWSRAALVPGLAALKPQDAGIDSVSCAPGGCVAGGDFLDASMRYHIFVTGERNGRWSRLTTLFTGKLAAFGITLSCPVQGSCAAGDAQPPFVASEAHSKWGRAHKLPASGKNDSVVVSCASAGNCTAAWGTLVASERNGRWGKPAAVPGLAKLGTGAAITSVSCTSAVNCAAGGIYHPDSNSTEVFVASERGGRWAKAMKLPGFTKLNTEGLGRLSAVSCVSAGNCVAGGSYSAPADFQGGSFQAFVASERNGRWGKAIEVPGIPAPSTSICEPDSDACVAGTVQSVSCSLGRKTCVAGGWYNTPAIDGRAAFVTSYKNGHWSKVSQIPGLASPDSSQINSISCTPAGPCAAGGSGPSGGPAFLTFEKKGTWSRGQPVRF
jgi:hypothetical protein